MHPPRLLPAALALLAALACLAPPPGAHACTSIMVGGHASTDGSIYIARSDDGDDAHSTVNNLVHHPARAGAAVFRSNLNKLTLELPAPGLAYFALPNVIPDPASGRNISGEAGGLNAAGVALSATESIYNSREALAADPHVPDGIIEDAIPSLLLPQASSARQGAGLLGRYVERYGAGEAFGVLFGDSKEAWYLETGSGHHWLAQRIPAHSFFVSANQGRLQECNLSDTDNVMSSPGLERFAVDAGLFTPAPGKPFNFFSAFMRDGPHDVNYSYPRVCLLQTLFAGTNSHGCLSARQPTFLPPAHKLGVRDIAASMRNHFDGSSHDCYLRRNPEERYRPILLLRTGNGHIMRLRPGSGGGTDGGGGGLPDGLSAIAYVAMATQGLSVFVPIYKGLPGDSLPRELTVAAAAAPDPHSLFWKARRLQALVFQDFPALAPPAMAAIREYEARVEEEERPAMEKRYIKAVRQGDLPKAGQLLVGFTHGVVEGACRLLDQLTRRTAAALGLPGVPPDERLVEMLDEAAEMWAFEPTSDGGDAAAAASSAADLARTVGGGGSAAGESQGRTAQW